MSQDVLESGVHRSPRSRRRLAAGLGVALLAVPGFWLAGRSDPDRTPAAAPSPAIEVPRPQSGAVPVVVDMVVGGDAAYLLLGRCPDFTSLDCTHELLTSSGTGDWRPTGISLPNAGHGFSSRLLIGDRLAVVDEDARTAYAIRGGSYDRRPITTGRAVAGLSPGLVLDRDDLRLLAFDPATAVRSPLATQPPLDVLGDVRTAGSVVAAVGQRDGATWLALSRDGGRRWSATKVPLRKGPILSRVALGADDTVFVLAGRDEHDDVMNEFSELWQLSGGRWSDITPRRHPRSAASLSVYGPQLLITEETGGLWELVPGGPTRRLPAPTRDGAAIEPTYVVSGPNGVLLAQAQIDTNVPAVLSSTDGGRTWTVFVPS